MPAKPPTLVLDLDGTLVDSAHDLMGTLNAILLREGLAPVPLEAARSMIGHGARALLERGLGANGEEVTTARIDGLYDDFIEHYAAHIADQTRPYPGVIEAIDRLAGEGWRLAVCTNKLEWLARRLLDALDLTERFSAITGGDTFEIRKPDPAHLTGTIARAGGDPRRAVMVGDSRSDVEAALAASIPVVAVDFGYTEVPVETLGPTRVISHFDQLYDAARAILPPRATAPARSAPARSGRG